MADYSELNAGGTILDMNIDYYDAFPRSSKKVVDALESGDTSPLNRHDMGTYVNSKKYLDSLANGEDPHQPVGFLQFHDSREPCGRDGSQ